MKSGIIKFAIPLLLLLSSCDRDILELQPSDQLSDGTVWSSPETANLFLNDIYNSLNAGPIGSSWLNLPAQVGNDPLADYTDDGMYGAVGGTPSYALFDNSSYGPDNLIFKNTWSIMYENIRKTNLLIEKVTASELKEEDKENFIAQSRFLRAYFYKTLIDLYGGVPIITTVLDRNNGEQIAFPRNTYEECVTFLQNEMAEISEILHAQITTPENLGRATKGAALAIKGEAELYAGRWEAAAATNWEIIQPGNYSLFPDYAGLFYADNENNEEVIFDIQYAANIKPKHINQYWGVIQSTSGAGWGNGAPTQELVDSYEFRDGKTAAEGSAFYDPSAPYKNRDSRFYASIIYDGSIWRGDRIYTRLGIPNNPNEINLVGRGGNTNRTGYMIKKVQDSTISSRRSDLDGTNVIIFRYAEVLLNYAEAKNESSGPDQTVYDAVNDIRSRAGQPPLEPGLGQEEMRYEIRQERRVELAFEGQRFYDIRRWRISEEIFSQPIHGIKIIDNNGELTYEKVPVRNVVFNASKNYLMPIPQYAIDQNPELTQNPGY
jgi:hypothetical protein